MTAAFAHLHVHSEYSLVDSTLRIPELVRACATRGVPALAITDRNNLFALVKFQAEAEKAGIKPIAGADVLLADGDANPARLVAELGCGEPARGQAQPETTRRLLACARHHVRGDGVQGAPPVGVGTGERVAWHDATVSPASGAVSRRSLGSRRPSARGTAHR